MFITAICGAETDPQNIRQAKAERGKSGAAADSNAQSAVPAGLLQAAEACMLWGDLWPGCFAWHMPDAPAGII